jgi:formamidopyrimidine-DNA glycosylase
MPELPEVEVAARSLSAWARGRRVRAVTVTDRRTLDGGKPAALAALVGTRLESVERIGKNLLLTFRRGPPARQVVGVWSHLGMTGKWLRRAPAEPAPRFARVRLDFVGGPTLYFADLRLFGFFRLVPGADFAALPVLAALGPDPLRTGIDTARLAERFGRSRLPIKVSIMDQALIPGVGNIQASEGLNRAGIDPRRPARSLTKPEIARLARGLLASFHHTLRSFEKEGVLPPQEGARAATGSPKAEKQRSDVSYVEESGTHNPFRVYDRAGARCPRCRKGTIERIVQAGRSTYFCPACQR